MPSRLLQLIGGLLAVGALAVLPTAANAGGGSGCNDDYRPHSSWGDNWYGHDGDGPYWRGWGDGDGYFGGRSSDRGCDGSGYSARAARVGRVMVAVHRLRGAECDHLSRAGDLAPRGDCKARWFRATGTRRWHHHIVNPLPAGTYRVMHRAIDAAGNRGRVHVMRVRIR